VKNLRGGEEQETGSSTTSTEDDKESKKKAISAGCLKPRRDAICVGRRRRSPAVSRYKDEGASPTHWGDSEVKGFQFNGGQKCRGKNGEHERRKKKTKTKRPFRPRLVQFRGGESMDVGR